MGRGTSHTQKDALTREDIARLWYTEFMSRTRMYPQDIANPIPLAPDAVANVFGDWTEIIPAGTVPFNFHIHSLQTMGADGAASFFVQLALNAAPAGNQYLGEKAFALGAAGRVRVDFDCPSIPANTPVYGRLKTSPGNITLDIALSVVRCICSPDIVKLLAAKRTSWPW